MDFGDQYLTYKEYKSIGGNIEEAPFNLLEFDVRKRINKRTFNRLVNDYDLYDDVKICVFKMIDVLNKYQPLETQNKTIASENTDGYSVSYRKLEESDIRAKDKELEEMIETYLADIVINNIPVLYVGVD